MQHPVRIVLDKRGIRHRWFAAEVGVRRETLSRVLSGRRKPPPGFYAAAERVLCIPRELLIPPIHWLTGAEDGDPPVPGGVLKEVA